jgi:chromosome segregation ATPase
LEEIDKLKKNIQEIITNSEREISLREEKIENVKNEFLKREKELALEYETKIKELVGIKEDLAKEIKEIQRRMEEERLLMEDKNKLLENKISTLIAEKESITNELKFAQNKIAELEATLRDYKDKLEKNNSSWEEKLLEKEQQINSLKLQLAEKDNIIKSLQLTSEEEKSKVKKVLEERLKKLGLIEGTSAPQKEKIIEKESKIQSTEGKKQAPASSTATQQTANVDNKTNIEKKVEEKEVETESIHKAKPTKKFWSI